MNPFLTACTGMDALTHDIEAFVSTGNSPITDNHAINGIKYIIKYIEKAVKSPNNMEARYFMMLGSLEAGLAFSNASLGAVHAMSHSLGGYYDYAHGECNTLLLPHVINFNYEAEKEKYNFVGELIGLKLSGMRSSEKRKAIVDKIIDIKRNLNVDYTFKSKGMSNNEFGILAENAINDPCMLTNPRKVNNRDIEVIYEEAY